MNTFGVCSALLLGTILSASFNVKAESIKAGRYLVADNNPNIGALDFLSTPTSIKFSASASTIGDAINAVLSGTGYSLVSSSMQPTLFKSLLEFELPQSMRSFNRLTKRAILEVLIGDGFFIVTDEVNRLVGFEPYLNTLTHFDGQQEYTSTDNTTDVNKDNTLSVKSSVSNNQQVYHVNTITKDVLPDQEPIVEHIPTVTHDSATTRSSTHSAGEQYISATGRYRVVHYTGAAEFDLHKGLLKPQVIELLLEHRFIDTVDDIQWQAADNLMWPNTHTISGASIDHIINDLLKAYHLVAEFGGNGSVVIKSL